MTVQYIAHKNIDQQKWDTCISQSLAPSIYCTANYLNILAKNWDALILGDYEYIMPVIFNSKYGIKYCYQPAFLPHINIFSNKPITTIVFNTFITFLSSNISFAEISFAQLHTVSPLNKSIKTKQKTNFTLNLNKPYLQIYSNYLPYFTKSLRRLQKHTFAYSHSTNTADVFLLFKTLYLQKIKHLSAKDVQHFEKLCNILVDQHQCVVKYVKDVNQNLLAGVVLLIYKNRLYNILSCVTLEGKKMEANYFLYDSIVKEYSSKPFVLDFEGSEIAGIANFYKKMNPINEPTMAIKYNNLPKLVKLFKK